MTICNRCQRTGFINYDHIDEDSEEYKLIKMQLMLEGYDESDTVYFVLVILEKFPDVYEHVSVCDCCGDGITWYGEPGEHYGWLDPIGPNGPYQYNGGQCECH